MLQSYLDGQVDDLTARRVLLPPPTDVGVVVQLAVAAVVFAVALVG